MSGGIFGTSQFCIAVPHCIDPLKNTPYIKKNKKKMYKVFVSKYLNNIYSVMFYSMFN